MLSILLFFLASVYFPKELLLWFVHHMYTGLSNGGRINDGRVVVRSVSVHSPANAASGARTDQWIHALPRLYYITPTPCIDIDFGARPYFFYYSLCINYLLCNNFLIIIITIISGLHYFLCTGKWSGDFGVTLPVCIDRAMSPLRRVELSAPPPQDQLGGCNLAPHQARTASSMPNILTS